MTLHRIAAMADVHYSRQPGESLQAVYREVSEKASVLLICGDLTDYGLNPSFAFAIAHWN